MFSHHSNSKYGLISMNVKIYSHYDDSSLENIKNKPNLTSLNNVLGLSFWSHLYFRSFRPSLLFRRTWFVYDVKDCFPLSRNRVAMIEGFPSP